MSAPLPEVAQCRHCNRILHGAPYHRGGPAPYIPGTSRQARRNYYGGWVCSEACDRGACLSLEQSMPGHGHSPSRSLEPEAEARVRANWVTP